MIVPAGRPCAIWRDAVQARVPDGAIRRTCADVGAFGAFQVPVYPMNLALGGANRGEMALAAGASAPAMLRSARPFGLRLDLSRRALGA